MKFYHWICTNSLTTNGLLILLVMVSSIISAQAQNQPVALVGATVIDVEDYGRSEKDIPDAVVVLKDGEIQQVGKKGSVKIPGNAQIISVNGKYIVPGLIDGFATLNDQSYANALLYMGITTIVGLENDNRRGKLYLEANPSPEIMKLDDYLGCEYKMEPDSSGGTRIGFHINYLNYHTPAQTRHHIDSLAAMGVKVLLIHYGVKPEQLSLVVEQARKHGIATIGELGCATYEQAVQAGVQSFVHTSRYTVDILPPEHRTVHTYSPFGRGGLFFYEYISRLPDLAQDASFRKLATLYGRSNVGLIPTSSMIVYPYMDFATNPWKEPVASTINEKYIEHEPLNKETGKPNTPAPHRQKAAPRLQEIDQRLAQSGAKFLTGSGTDAFGTLPGIALHTELRMLASYGLTNRQILAAATNNFSRLWGWSQIGKIEKGRQADVLILSANPLDGIENLKKIDMIFLDGKQIVREELLRK